MPRGSIDEQVAKSVLKINATNLVCGAAITGILVAATWILGGVVGDYTAWNHVKIESKSPNRNDEEVLSLCNDYIHDHPNGLWRHQAEMQLPIFTNNVWSYWMDSARKDQVTNGWKEALADYENALKVKPGEAAAIRQRQFVIDERYCPELIATGALLEVRNDWSGAYDFYKQALQLNPQDLSASQHLQSAIAKLYPEYLSEITNAEQNMESLDQNYEAGLDRGYDDESYPTKVRDDSNKIILLYGKIIELKPSSIFAYNNLGNAIWMNNFDEAIADYDQAITVKPDYAIAYNNRAVARFNEEFNEDSAKQNDPSDADGLISDLSKAIEINPDFDAAYRNRGVVEMARQNYGDAMADLNIASHLNPNCAETYIVRGILKQDMLHDFDGAIGDYIKVLALNYSRWSFDARREILTAERRDTSTWVPTEWCRDVDDQARTTGQDTNLFTPATTQTNPPAKIGTFRFTGSMLSVRRWHTATLLPDGLVLAAGGQAVTEDAPSDSLSSSELFDPQTGTWTTTGPMNNPRCQHTATLLPNGIVLVAGGSGNDFRPISTAELYDSKSSTWSSAGSGSMSTPRLGHSATLLQNGKVLVAGGSGNGYWPLTSAELFDPSTGAWTPTGSMSDARSHHTATLLPNGKVLVAGGNDTGTSAELYDPLTETWSATGTLNAGRSWHTATLFPDGKVLVTGGLDTNFYPISSAELYDPSVGTWSAAGRMSTPRSGHTAILLPSGQVLVSGGHFNFAGEVTDVADRYDPTAKTWSTAGHMNKAREGHTQTLLTNGQVLVAGGYSPVGNMLLISPEDGKTSDSEGIIFKGAQSCSELFKPSSDWKLAVPLKGKSLELKPDDSDALQERSALIEKYAADLVAQGKACEKANQFASAGQSYKDALKLKPGDPAVSNLLELLLENENAFKIKQWLVAGDLAANGKEWDEAIESFDRILTLEPFDKDVLGRKESALLKKGLSLSELWEYEEAVVCFDKALSLNSTNAVLTYNYKGLALVKLGRTGDALACFDTALSIDNRLEMSWQNKATALAGGGLLNDTILFCNKALIIFPEDAFFLQLKEQVAQKQKAEAEAEAKRVAEAAATAARESALNQVSDYLTQANTARAGGNLIDAKLACENAIKIDPKNADAWFLKAQTLNAMRAYSQQTISVIAYGLQAQNCYQKYLRFASQGDGQRILQAKEALAQLQTERRMLQ